MSLDFGNLLAGVAQTSSAASREKTLKSFLTNVNNLGIQTTNNFEVNFSGLSDSTFFIQSINIPGLELKTTEINYDGKKVIVPVNYDWNHEFSMTVINDAQGYIYSALVNFFMTESNSCLINSGYTLTSKALTGDSKYKGTLYTFFGVKITSIGQLSYSYDTTDKSIFDITMICNYFTVTPGALSKPSNILGALNSLIG